MLTALAAPGRSAGAEEAKEPYKVRVVLHFDRHPLLTKVFRGQVTRELRDGLRAALGDLGKVEVVDDHPRLSAALADGLGKSLDEWEGKSEFKTHFVLVDCVGPNYRVRARQHDGPTGFVSRVAREDRTRDRALVARTALLLMERDFGLLGTVVGEASAKAAKERLVEVQLRGGGLGVPLKRWVRAGDVFAVLGTRAARPGQQEDWPVLQVQEPPGRDGRCTCKLYSRYVLTDVAGLRCVKLGTAAGVPLRLKLRQLKANGELELVGPGLSVQVRRGGFEGEVASRPEVRFDGAVDTSGMKEAHGRFDHLAFVSVYRGETLRARVPVPLVADRLILLPVPAGSKDDALVGFRVSAFERDLAISALMQSEGFKEINALTAKGDKRARARTEAVLGRTRDDHERFVAERDALAAELKKLPDKERSSLAFADGYLRRLKSDEANLKAHLDGLRRAEDEEKDPKRVRWRSEVERGKLLEKEAEVGQAIAAYKKVLGEGYKSPELEAHLKKLEKLWATSGEAHEKARAFIYRDWPKLDTAGLKERLKDAKEHLAASREAKDTIGPRKMLKVAYAHRDRLIKELGGLKPDVNIDHKAPAELIKEVAPALKGLIDELQKSSEDAEGDKEGGK